MRDLREGFRGYGREILVGKAVRGVMMGWKESVLRSYCKEELGEVMLHEVFRRYLHDNLEVNMSTEYSKIIYKYRNVPFLGSNETTSWWAYYILVGF